MGLPLINTLPESLEESLAQAAKRFPSNYTRQVAENAQYIIKPDIEQRKNVLRKLHFPNTYITCDTSGVQIFYDAVSHNAFESFPFREIEDNNFYVSMKLALHDAGGEINTTLNTYSYDAARAKFQLPDLYDIKDLLEILYSHTKKPENVYTLFTQGLGMQDGEYFLDIGEFSISEGVFQVLYIKEGKVKIIDQPAFFTKNSQYTARVRPAILSHTDAMIRAIQILAL